MKYIYRYTNTINGKVYIGQTNDIKKRQRGHKSESFNPNANGYKLPFHNAIRKYGYDNFKFEILEEISDDESQEYVDEREMFFIQYFDALTTQNGYNVALGGAGVKVKLAFSQCCEKSKILNEEQVRDIQDMLQKGYQYFEIKKKYPKLSDSFLQNINNGWNFMREDLTYPLSTFHSSFSKEAQENIIQDIKSGVIYAQISKKYGISTSYLSQINNGTRWHNDNYKYPLCKKACAEGAYVEDLKYDLIFSNLTLDQLADEYGKSKACIRAISEGRNRHDNRLIYPLRKNKLENQKIYNTFS